MNRHLQTLFFLAVLSFLFTLSVNAQMTTASMSGKVVFQDEPVIGATILAVHEPSGTKYGTITNIDGRYSLEGMRTGGPYNVTISYVGYQTAIYRDITLKLGENYILDVTMQESSAALDEVVVVASKSKFSGEKTGAVTNINNTQLKMLPSINRSLTDFTRLSPYAGSGNAFSGRDGRMSSFTIDGANLNNNFGLSSNLPGGGNPVSLDAIEEVQVVVAPFDVRQSNFIGGGINAITKSGTNSFRGSAYAFLRNQNMRGNKVGDYDLGLRAPESTTTYGVTLGGPIIKDKLFFFVNGEYENSPSPITKFRLSDDGVGNKEENISRATAQDMENFASILRDKYGYEPGSYTNYDGGTKNYKVLARIDWNINDAHKLSLRYNYTTNSQDLGTNASSTVGTRTTAGRISEYAMAFKNNCYMMDNNVMSFTADLNSRFNDKISNKLLLTYSNIEDVRSSNSSPFPHIDIWDGDGQAFMSAGYELFSWNNKVQNKIFNVNDNLNIILGDHRITAGISFEYQKALNNFMRFGTGYYKYASFDDFKNGSAPIAFGLTYGYNGEANPEASVSFAQSGIYGQDEWNISDRFKLTYGIRLDMLNYLNSLETNKGYLDIDFNGRHIDTGKWPKANVLFSPRIGFNWDIKGDQSLKLRGGTGIFTGRIPLVFFTNMPTNAGMLQNTVQITDSKQLEALKGGVITDVNQMINTLGLPNTPNYQTKEDIKGAAIVGIDPNFKLPQVWKTALAVDYQLPVSFPLALTVEAMYNKDINAVCQENYNVKDPSLLGRFNGPDNRYYYESSKNAAVASNVTGGAMVLTNTHKGYGATLNFTANSEPVKNLFLMASYTHTIAKEISGNPGSQAYSAWQNLPSVDGPNLLGLHNSQYLTPNRVIASITYSLDLCKSAALNFGLYYSGYNSGLYSYTYNNDMNQDGQTNDLIYIPKSKDELTFVDKNGFTASQQADAFWNFINQDPYLKKHKGEYAEAYAAKMPWINRFDIKISEDFKIKAGKSTNILQISFDILNVGNLLNHSWGVTKNAAPANNGRILNYEGVNDQMVPTYSLYYNKAENALPTESFANYNDSSNCWQLQVGIRYIFN